ncbi:MAG: right-handed parallel beta-helix repeat-containing protein [Bacteroidetes bacterium]|nr:right-handed parallel beta-helix repeat-containing protein [Bacteroidota bacterium]
MHNGFGFWGMLSDWGTKSYVANSFERAQLQWMDNTDFCTLDASAGSAPDTTLNLTDYITNNQAIKVIVDTTDDKYFYIENHQNLSYWETHAPFSDHPNSTDGLVENGIYVIRQHSFSNGSNIMEMSKSLIPADGRYSWNAIDAIPNPYGGTKILPVWEKLGEDKYNGYHTLEFVPHTNTTPGVQNPSSIYFGFKSTFPFWEDISEHQGDGEDAFRIGYNDTFGPRTNPNTQMKDRVIVDFTVKLNSDSSGIYSLSVYFNYWEGELESDVNFTGNITVGGDLTVPSGRTLTVASGSQLTFTNNSSLIVDGTLNVNGTTTEKVIFDFVAQNSTTQNGIKINNGASVNIDHAIIKNAYRGIYVNEDLTLTNSEIKDCQTGLYQYNSGYTYIRNNKFHNNDDVGAYLYNSNGTFIENEFSYNDIGIECIYNSSPNLINGYNEFNTNFIGVFVDHSHPMLGIVEGCIDDGGYNSFDFSVDHHMFLQNNSIVYAQKNWWNSYASIYIESGSQCFRVPDLSSKPVPLGTIRITPEEEMFNKKFSTQLSSANRLEKNLTTTVANDFKYNVNWSLDWKLLYARKLIEIKKYNFAIKVCEDIIEQYPDSSLSYLALHLLHKASVKGKEKDKFKKFVDNKSKLKVKKQLYGYAELLLTMEEKENRILELNNLKEKYKDTDLVESVLFDKFMYFLNEENNLELAKLVSEELGKLFPNSRLYISSQRQLGVDVETPKMSELKKGNSEEEVADIPKTYELLGNYPNPFNPSTTISYALPYSSNVELTIYDITGKVVKVFNERVQSAGYQNIVWFGNNQQGSRVSSGVYFYRFKAVSLEGNGKVFEKTTKMLLLK